MFINLDTIVNYQKPPRRTIYLWNKTDFDAIRREFSPTFLSRNSVDSDINELLLAFKQKLKDTMMHMVPSKTSSTRYNQLWIG